MLNEMKKSIDMRFEALERRNSLPNNNLSHEEEAAQESNPSETESEQSESEPASDAEIQEDNLPETLTITYPVPEDAKLINNCSGILWNDVSITNEDILLLRDPSPQSQWTFKLKPQARISDSLLDLVSAAKLVPAAPVTQSAAFTRAFKFLDDKISSSTGWSAPNNRDFTVNVTQMKLQSNLESLSKDVLTYKSQYVRVPKLTFVSDNEVIRYFQSNKLDNAHNYTGLHLAGKMSRILPADSEREYSLRQ